MARKIGFFTGTRADYGLLFPLMKKMQSSSDWEISLLVSGMHLSPEFGYTVQQIEKDGFKVDYRVENLLSADTPLAQIKSTALGLMGYGDALSQMSPDFLVILGDRFEAFAAATAAYILHIPIVHLHGGETTQGATDEAFRHAITKMAYWHFTSTEEHKKRVVQLGESPDRVFNVGALGLDNIRSMSLHSKEQNAASLGISATDDYLLVTYHPETLSQTPAVAQLEILVEALLKASNHTLVCTLPNADAEGRSLIEAWKTLQNKFPERLILHTSLGQLRYLSAVKHAQAVVGNSSSGIIEVPSLGIPTVNVGYRQAGRLAASSVIHCPEMKVSALIESMKLALSADFQEQARRVINGYGDGQTAEKICDHLSQFPTNIDLRKTFFDV
ncbi:MAG: UDP-N-acetylglucosamine 2-epimerase [Spirosomataceae bacterium]